MPTSHTNRKSLGSRSTLLTEDHSGLPRRRPTLWGSKDMGDRSFGAAAIRNPADTAAPASSPPEGTTGGRIPHHTSESQHQTSTLGAGERRGYLSTPTARASAPRLDPATLAHAVRGSSLLLPRERHAPVVRVLQKQHTFVQVALAFRGGSTTPPKNVCIGKSVYLSLFLSLSSPRAFAHVVFDAFAPTTTGPCLRFIGYVPASSAVHNQGVIHTY